MKQQDEYKESLLKEYKRTKEKLEYLEELKAKLVEEEAVVENPPEVAQEKIETGEDIENGVEKENK